MLVRLFLVGFLFFPTIAQHAHVFAAHDHPVCHESKLHLHEIDTSCDLLDYLSSPHALAFFTSLSLNVVADNFQPSFLALVDYSNNLFCTYLRGPPSV